MKRIALALAMLLPALASAQADILSNATTSSTTMVVGPATLLAIHYRDTGSSGNIVFRDATDSTERLTMYTPGQVGEMYIDLPDGGMVFRENIYVDFTNVDAVTIWYK